MASIVEALVSAIMAGLDQDEPERRGHPRRGSRDQGGIPTVGPKGANEVRLSPELHALLRKRVTRQNRREHNPEIEMLQSRRARIDKGLERDLAGIENFTEAASQTIANQPLKGLQGRFRQDVAEEFAQRSADIAQSAPILASEAHADAREQKSALAEKILGARIEKKQAIESELSTALGAARTDAQSTIKTRRAANKQESEDQGAKSRDRKQEYNLAVTEAQRLLSTYAGQEPETIAEWAAFEGEVAKAEGVGLEAAHNAVQDIMERMPTPEGELNQKIPQALGQVADYFGG